jgi:sortase A
MQFPTLKLSKKSKKIIVIIFGIILIGLVVLYFYYFHKNQQTLPMNNTPYSAPMTVAIQPDDQFLAFGIQIDKLGIKAPVMKNVDGSNQKVYDAKLQNGVAQMMGSALPGGKSNIFIFGHSSSSLKADAYSKIFATLNNLQKNDEIIIFYQTKEYDYFVTSKEIVEKTDVALTYPTKTEQLTLMTCWPIGTADKRLIIIAKPK